MITIFHLFQIVGALSGAMAGIAIGVVRRSVVSGIVFVVIGALLGGIVGRLPLWLGLAWARRGLARLPLDELRVRIRDANARMPNLALVELSRRGESLEPELPFVLAMMTSPSHERRCTGLAALISAFPNVARELGGYTPNDPPEISAAKIEAYCSRRAQTA